MSQILHPQEKKFQQFIKKTARVVCEKEGELCYPELHPSDAKPRRRETKKTTASQ